MLDIIHLCVEHNFMVNLFQSSLEIAIFCKTIVSVQRPWLLRKHYAISNTAVTKQDFLQILIF